MHFGHSSPRASGTRAFAIGVLATLALAACSSDPTAPRVVSSVSIVSGNTQSTVVGVAPANALVVRVADQNGAVLSGIPVNWVLSGAGTLSSSSTLTDESGLAQVTVTPGTATGSLVVTAFVSGLTATTFTLALTPAAESVLTLESGDAQTAPIGSELPTALVVRVTDVYGNAVAGVTVTWTTEEGGSFVTVSATTDASGRARTTLTLGPTVGANSVIAAAQGLTSVTFNFIGE